MNNVDKMALAATLDLRCQIAWAAERALKELGLPRPASSYEEARTVAKLASPLYVRSISIKGQEARDMYDEHPGYAYYYSDTSEVIEDVPAYCSISQAKEIAACEFTKLMDIANARAEEDQCSDGDFTPHSIILRDQFGQPLMEYSKGKWQDEMPAEGEWPAMLEEADRLSAEASEESRWDNFDTSRGLSNRADALRRRVTCAQLIARAIH